MNGQQMPLVPILESFICTCSNGYSGNGNEYHDDNECELSTHTCDKNSRCSNIDGSFECSCNLGFNRDGFACDGADECAKLPCDQTVTKLLPYMTAHVLVVSMVMVLHLRTK